MSDKNIINLRDFINQAYNNFLFENVLAGISNDDKGKLHELLVAKYLHPEERLPEHFRADPNHPNKKIKGKSPEEVHEDIKGRISPEHYDIIDRHSREQAEAIIQHSIKTGRIKSREDIQNVHWTSNADTIKKKGDHENLTGFKDVNSNADVILTTNRNHPTDRFIPVSLKIGGQPQPNLKNYGLESLENESGLKPGDLTDIKSDMERELFDAVGHRHGGINTSASDRHEKFKVDRESYDRELKAHRAAGGTISTFSPLSEEARAAATAYSISNKHRTRMVNKIVNSISQISSDQNSDEFARNFIKRSAANETKIPHILSHAFTQSDGSNVAKTEEAEDFVKSHLSNYRDIHVRPVEETSDEGGGTSFAFYGTHVKTGKVEPVARQVLKNSSGPYKGVVGSFKLENAKTEEAKKPAGKKQKATKSEEEAGSGQHGPIDFHSKDELRPVNENVQLNEATTETKQGKQTHLEHIEDLAYDGHEGVGLADQHLRQMHNYLLGARRNTPDRVETKVDGAPAFHVFKDNEGRIGVGTKSMFNKNPKLNFTEEDIDANHGHAPGLAAVLKQVLTHAHKMVPSDMKPGEIYKGDFLFGDGSSGRGRETTDEFHEFQPNTLRYKVPLDSPEGAKVGNAKIGVALHTYFGTDGVAGPIDKKRRAKLLDHPDVYNYDPTVDVNPVNHTPMEQRQFEEHMENARKAYSKIKPEVYDQLVGHDQHMRTYTNQRVRAGAEGPGNVDEYLDFLNQRAQKDINSVKTQAAKDRKTKQHAALMQQVVQNAKHVQNIFDMHNHLQNAKNVLIGVSGKNSNEAVELPDGSPTGHEGYVSTIKTGDGGQHQGKFVDRAEFSRANFAQGSFQKPVQESLEEGIVDRLKGMFKSFRGNKSQNHHLVWGRMNPIHAGHEMVMKAAAEAANRDNGNVSLVLTGTQDKTKNPLSADQKLKHARRAFPGIDVSVADKSNPTILHQAAKLYNNGIKNLTVHVGSDRVGQFSKLLNDYNGVNGKGHGYYQFHNINVVPVGGERDEDAGGVAGASATKMREAAANNDRESFHSMAPSTMKPEHVDEMMADVQAGMTRKEELSAYFINRFKTLRG